MEQQVNNPSHTRSRLELIGRGGSTKVFRAVGKQQCDMLFRLSSLLLRALARGLTLAVKIWDLTFADKSERENIRREIDFNQSFDHPHIVRFLGAKQYEKSVHLYMEYFMTSLVRDKSKIRFWFIGVCAAEWSDYSTTRRNTCVWRVGSISLCVANSQRVTVWPFRCWLLRGSLKYLHTRSVPVIHRDLKSENVFICKHHGHGYTLKLGDFGESTTLERKTIFHARLKRSACHVGTTEFRAPELVRFFEISKFATEQLFD